MKELFKHIVALLLSILIKIICITGMVCLGVFGDSTKDSFAIGMISMSTIFIFVVFVAVMIIKDIKYDIKYIERQLDHIDDIDSKMRDHELSHEIERREHSENLSERDKQILDLEDDIDFACTSRDLMYVDRHEIAKTLVDLGYFKKEEE